MTDARPPYESSLAFLLSQVGARSAELFADRLATIELMPRQFAVMATLDDRTTVQPSPAPADPSIHLSAARHGPQSQQHLADALGIHRNNMVSLIDGLEAAGLVRRTREPSDRRSFTIVLTDVGHARLESAYALVAEVEAELTSAFDQSSIEVLRLALIAAAPRLALQPGIHPSLTNRRR